MQSTAIIFSGTFSNAGLPLDYPDTVMNTRTKYLYDALDTASWPSQAATVSGSRWKDIMIAGSGDAIAGSDVIAFTGGFVLSATTNQRFTLPSSAKIAATSKGFIATTWVKPAAMSTGQYRAFGWHYNFTGPWGALYDGSSGKHQFIADGDLVGAGVALSTSAPHCISIGRVSDDGGTTFKRILCIDGVVNSTSTSGATCGQPSVVPSTATIGDDAASSVGGEWLGTVYRHWVEDAGTTTGIITSAYFLAQHVADYNANIGRFS